jgi:hypothetical protein
VAGPLARVSIKCAAELVFGCLGGGDIRSHKADPRRGGSRSSGCIAPSCLPRRGRRA